MSVSVLLCTRMILSKAKIGLSSAAGSECAFQVDAFCICSWFSGYRTLMH